MLITLIIPAYNEEKMIGTAADTISGILADADIAYEMIFVDDGSKDGTWDEIVSASSRIQGVRGLHFSRNFGTEAAMFAGLSDVRGECAAVLDCDLQHPPEKLVEMYRLWEQGYEVIEGIKEDRGKESAAHRFAANRFYSLISGATGVDMSSSSDFKLLDRKVVDTLNKMPEKNVFFRALSFWVGFRRTEVKYKVQERTEGESKWSTASLIKYALNNISSFSSAPLKLIIILGLIMMAVSVVFGAISLVQKFMGQAADGFTTVNILLLFSASIIMISLGMIGFYVARIYDEIKGRPRYIISDRTDEK